jgi:hypothetical protein
MIPGVAAVQRELGAALSSDPGIARIFESPATAQSIESQDSDRRGRGKMGSRIAALQHSC